MTTDKDTRTADPLSARILLVVYYGLTRLVQPVLGLHLRRRLARGKEDPKRWQEKLAKTQVPRPEGQVIWLHAVGLGEVLTLRGVIAALAERLPKAHFLVTSSTRASAQVFAQNLPARTIHQFLPLDTPAYGRRFLNHWRPDLAIWTEQDLWPGILLRAARRGVPLALINARMTDDSRIRFRPVFQALFARFSLISAQDARSAARLADLGARGVTVAGLLKSIAPPLHHDPASRSAVEPAVAGRFVWIAASTHPEDEAQALAAHGQLLRADPEALLVIVPRHPTRAEAVLEAARAQDMTLGLEAQVHVVQEFGALGLWYRLAQVAFIGGTHSAIEGHNPWEAATLGCAVLHGPRFKNFAADFPTLKAAGGARMVPDAAGLAQALQSADTPQMGAAARACAEAQRQSLAPLFDALAGLAV